MASFTALPVQRCVIASRLQGGYTLCMALLTNWRTVSGSPIHKWNLGMGIEKRGSERQVADEPRVTVIIAVGRSGSWFED